MNKIPSKYVIIIPSNIQIFYSRKKKIIVFKGPLKKRSLKVDVQLLVSEKEQKIKISSISNHNLSNTKRKKIKSIQGTTAALIKQLIVETSTILYKKLKIVGVGYRAFGVDNYKNKLLLFKLGYSHSIYFRIPIKLNIFCLKFTKLFICGSSYSYIAQTAALIRSKKTPEPYKGKGIIYETENIILKEGKKN